MTTLDTILARTRPQPAEIKATTELKAPPWALRAADTDRQTLPDLATVEAQTSVATRLSWIYTAVTIVSRMAAATPFQVKRRSGEGATAILNHPFEGLLQRPNPLQSRFEFLEATFAWRMMTGNAYWWLNRGSETEEPSELWVIPAHQIQPVPDGKSYLRGYLYDPGNGQKIPLDVEEVCHFKTFNPLNKFIGLSPLQSLRLGIIGDLAAQQWGTNFYAQDNAKIGGVLAFADLMTKPDWDRMKEDIKREHGGAKGARMMLLNGAGKGGVEWIATQLSQDDMQFLEQRQFTKEEIWSVLAPGLASMLAINANVANARQGETALRAVAIYPAHTAIAETASNDVLPAYGDGLVGEFEDVRLKDTAMELQVAQARRSWWSVNELRAEEGKDALDGELWENVPATAALRMFNPDQWSKLTGLSEKPKEEPVPAMLPLPRPPLQLPGPTPAEEGMATVEDSTEEELAQEALSKWQTKALNRLRKGERPACDFDSPFIPTHKAKGIRLALEYATDPAGVRAAFKGASGRVTVEGLLEDGELIAKAKRLREGVKG